MAGWLMARLGYGHFAIIDPENPDNPPSVTAAVTAPNYDTFTRIMQGQYNNNEEVRFEVPTSYMNNYEYVAVAPVGSLPTEPVWSCVRCEWVNNKKTRLQFRQSVSWIDRSIGW